MQYLDQKIKKRIEDKVKLLNSFRPLPTAIVEKLKEQFSIEMTYNSNAIEGNSLTLKETYLVISEGITIKGKPLKDHIEAKNHKEALDYLYGLAVKEKNDVITEKLIRSVNQIVLKNTDDEWSGRYRNSSVVISGSEHKPPEAMTVPGLMEDLTRWIKKNYKSYAVVDLAGIIHHKIVYIHPFFDGNGRTARLIMNIVLMQAGYPLAVVLKNDRKKYYNVLSKADKGDYKPLIKFIAQAVERTLDIYLKILTPTGKPKEKFVTLSQLAKGTKFSEKYLNLLAREGKLDAHKEGRNWLSSREALKKYLDNRERKRK